MKIAILTDTPQTGQSHDTPYGPSAAVESLPLGAYELLVCAPESADPRATVQALKDLGATHLWLCESVAALSPLLEAGDWIVPDDFIDGTRGQHYTYFSEKAGGYTQQVPPFDPASREALLAALGAIYRRPFRRGVYVCVSSTRLETPAEAAFWSRAGAHVAGRLLSPYLPLARELDMPVAVLARVVRAGGAPGKAVPLFMYFPALEVAMTRLEPPPVVEPPDRTEYPPFKSELSQSDPSASRETFARFSKGAKRALGRAYQEADSLQQSVIGTEHRLLALIRDEQGPAGLALRAMRADYPRMKAMVEAMSKDAERAPDAELELSSEVKEALKAALDEAKQLGQRVITTANLLLALVSQEDSSAVAILHDFDGITPQDVRRIVHQVIQPIVEQRTNPNRVIYRVFPGDPHHLLHVLISDKETGELNAELQVTLSDAHSTVSRLFLSFFQPKAGKIAEMDDETGQHIEISIEERDQPPETPVKPDE